MYCHILLLFSSFIIFRFCRRSFYLFSFVFSLSGASLPLTLPLLLSSNGEYHKIYVRQKQVQSLFHFSLWQDSGNGPGADVNTCYGGFWLHKLYPEEISESVWRKVPNSISLNCQLLFEKNDNLSSPF